MAQIEDNKITGPGSKLAKARRAAGYSRDEVAAKLHLSVTVIRQLENDQYDEQIPDAFARGYLRNYAKLLDLDPQEVIAKYSQMIGSSMVKNYYEPSKTVAATPEQGPLSGTVIWLVLVAAVIVVGTIWFMWSNEPVTSETQASQPTTESEKATSENIIVKNTVKSDDIQSEAVVEQEEQSAVITAGPEAVIAETIPTGFQQTAEAQLEFYFKGDCWVQVTDANGEVMAVGLKTAGRRFEVTGIAPINIVLGKPRQVDITYNQESVDLSCLPSGSTARFELTTAQACDGM